MVSLLTWYNESSKQIKLKHGYWQTEYWCDCIYDDESLICNKIKGLLLYVEKKKEEKIREGERGSTSYKLNIMDEFSEKN